MKICIKSFGIVLRIVNYYYYYQNLIKVYMKHFLKRIRVEGEST